ncbi:hypothetical protein HDE_00878 [Halotydeus destructor]|nr:hypothetical protein HDE_00878 [Halotydeus destructor]
MTYSIQRIVNCLNQFVDKDDLFCLKEARDLIAFFNDDLVKGFDNASETLLQTILTVQCGDNATPLYRLLLYGSCAKALGGSVISDTPMVRSGLSLLATTSLATSRHTADISPDAAATELHSEIRKTILTGMEDWLKENSEQFGHGSSHQCHAVKLGRTLDEEMKKWKTIFEKSMTRLEQCRDARRSSEEITLSDIESCIDNKLSTQTELLSGRISSTRNAEKEHSKDSNRLIPMIEQCLRNVIADPTQSITSNISSVKNMSETLGKQLVRFEKLTDSLYKSESGEAALTAAQVATEVQQRLEKNRGQYIEDLIAAMPALGNSAELASGVLHLMKPVLDQFFEWQKLHIPNQISQKVVQSLTSDETCFVPSCIHRLTQCRQENAVVQTSVARLQIELESLHQLRQNELEALKETVRVFGNELTSARERYTYVVNKYNDSMDQICRIERVNSDLRRTVATVKNELTESGYSVGNAVVREILENDLQNVEVKELVIRDISTAMIQEIEEDSHYAGLQVACFSILKDQNVNSRINELQNQLEQFILHYTDGKEQAVWLAMAIFSQLAEKGRKNIELARIMNAVGLHPISDEFAQEIGYCFSMIVRCCMRSMSDQELQDVTRHTSELAFKVAQVIASFTKVNQELEQGHSRNRALQEESGKLKQNYADIQEKLRQSAQLVAETERQKALMEQNVRELANDNQAHSSAVEHWKSRHASECEKRKELEEETIKQASTITQLEAVVSVQASQKQDTVSKVQFDKLWNEHESLLRELARSRTNFESELEELKTALRIEKNSSVAFQTDIKRLRDDLVRLNDEHSACLPNDEELMVLRKTEYEDLVKDVGTFKEMVSKEFSATRGDTMIDIRKYWKVVILEIRKQLDPTLRGKKIKRRTPNQEESELKSSGDERKRKPNAALTTFLGGQACPSVPVATTDTLAISRDKSQDSSMVVDPMRIEETSVVNEPDTTTQFMESN